MTSEATPLPTCTNCIHVATVGSHDWERFLCMAPQNFAGTNLVDGHREYLIPLCKDQRDKSAAEAADGSIRCRKEGKWFEPKPVEQEHKPQVATSREAKAAIAKGISAEDL